MEKNNKDATKQNPMKDYDRTNRNFQATDEDIKAGKKEKGKLKPGKYPVNEGGRVIES